METRWVTVCAVNEDGDLTSAKLKAWTGFRKEDVLWDGSLVFETMYPKQKFCPIINISWDKWCAFWEDLGFDPHNCYIPSQQSCRAMEKLQDIDRKQAHPAYGVDETKIKTVFQFDSKGLVSMLCGTLITARAGVKSRTKGLLTALLNHFCQDGPFKDNIERPEILGEILHHDVCDAQPDGADGKCEHIRDALIGWPFARNLWYNLRLVDCLSSLAAAVEDCSRCRHFFLAIVVEMSSCFFTALDSIGAQDAFKESHERGKRRIDEDYKQTLMRGLVKDGRAANPSSACRLAFGQSGRKKARNWLVKDVAEQIQQSEFDFSPTRAPTVYGRIKDATRLGQPARDFQASFLWRFGDNKSTWLLPQDIPSYRLPQTVTQMNPFLAPRLKDFRIPGLPKLRAAHTDSFWARRVLERSTARHTHAQTNTNTDRHIQVQTRTDKHKQTQTNPKRQNNRET